MPYISVSLPQRQLGPWGEKRSERHGTGSWQLPAGRSNQVCIAFSVIAGQHWCTFTRSCLYDCILRRSNSMQIGLHVCLCLRFSTFHSFTSNPIPLFASPFFSCMFFHRSTCVLPLLLSLSLFFTHKLICTFRSHHFLALIPLVAGAVVGQSCVLHKYKVYTRSHSERSHDTRTTNASFA